MFRNGIKILTLLAFTLPLGGCKTDAQSRLENRYSPQLHYQRYPIVVKQRYGHTRAVVAPCGDFSRNLAHTQSNEPSKNFGCATQHNLAAMVSNPNDFIRPRDQTPPDATRRTKVITNYRTPAITATPKDADMTIQLSNAIK